MKETLSNAEIERWYRAYGPMVLRRCRQLLGNEERARDAMHETFVRVLQSSSRIRGGFPSSLLFRVATNVCLNIIRDDKVLGRSVRIDALGEIAGRDESAARASSGPWMDRLFRRANPVTRDMAVLHFVDGMTFAEVAAETGYSESGVRKRIRAWLTRARRAHPFADAKNRPSGRGREARLRVNPEQAPTFKPGSRGVQEESANDK